MGFMDKANELKEKAVAKAKEAMGDDDKVDRAADKLDDATGNKYSDQIDKAAGKAKERNDNLDG